MKPASPLRNQPSMNALAVASGLFQYPRTLFGPLIHSSPICPRGSSLPLSSAIFTSVPTTGRPIESMRCR